MDVALYVYFIVRYDVKLDLRERRKKIECVLTEEFFLKLAGFCSFLFRYPAVFFVETSDYFLGAPIVLWRYNQASYSR